MRNPKQLNNDVYVETHNSANDLKIRLRSSLNVVSKFVRYVVAHLFETEPSTGPTDDAAL